MTNRFDLEQQLLECWHVTTDIDTIAEGISNQNLSNDEIVNTLNGIRTLYEIKFDILWSTFEQLVGSGHIK